MRKSRFVIAAVAAAALALGGALPAQASTRTPVHATARGSIVDVLVADSGGGTPDRNPWDYDLLVQAVLATGLAPTLADTSQRFTVFAPDDEAFMRLVTSLTGHRPQSEAAALTTITSTFTIAQIKNLLLYHVVAGKRLGPLQVLTSRSITMANGGKIYPRFITLHDGNNSLPDPRLVLCRINIPASNGVIHTIDRVLVPASL
jgi:uncharacterized surface protein with fasciclin (FAS1) repeats